LSFYASERRQASKLHADSSNDCWTFSGNRHCFGFPHGRNSRTVAPTLERECNEESVEFRGDLTRLAGGGGIVAYTSHFNQQRRQCLVEITSNRPEDSQISVYDQIFEPKEGSFVASRARPSGARPTSVGVIVMGAPVPAQQETAAEAWFDDLMTK
jgi:hypothetical protein